MRSSASFSSGRKSHRPRSVLHVLAFVIAAAAASKGDSFPQNVALLVTTITLIAAVLAGIFVLSRTKGNKDSIEILVTANQGLRSAYDDVIAKSASDRTDFEKQLRDQKHEFELKLVEQDRDCQRQLGEIRGQMQVLTGSFAGDIARALTPLILAVKDGSSS